LQDYLNTNTDVFRVEAKYKNHEEISVYQGSIAGFSNAENFESLIKLPFVMRHDLTKGPDSFSADYVTRFSGNNPTNDILDFVQTFTGSSEINQSTKVRLLVFTVDSINEIVVIEPIDRAESINNIVGTWQGTYTCSQGLTNLDLTINNKVGNIVTAEFSFSAHPTNPSTPSGSFEMRGILEQSRYLKLSAFRWTDKPRNYAKVDLDGYFSENYTSYAGDVLFIIPGSCTTFDLHR
jgi:hypothetical protein